MPAPRTHPEVSWGGQRIGRWEVLGPAPATGYWLCRCLGCGYEQAFVERSLRRGELSEGGCKSCREAVTWPPEALEYLREHWGKLSAREIGEALGKTRNAVLGKGLRLGLARQNKSSTTRARRKAARARRREKETTSPSKPIPLLQLTSKTCRFPVSGEGGATMFCGAPSAEAAPYCGPHMRATHTKPEGGPGFVVKARRGWGR